MKRSSKRPIRKKTRVSPLGQIIGHGYKKGQRLDKQAATKLVSYLARTIVRDKKTVSEVIDLLRSELGGQQAKAITKRTADLTIELVEKSKSKGKNTSVKEIEKAPGESKPRALFEKPKRVTRAIREQFVNLITQQELNPHRLRSAEIETLAQEYGFPISTIEGRVLPFDEMQKIAKAMQRPTLFITRIRGKYDYKLIF